MAKNNYTYKKGYLNVSDNHKIYFELYGNPKGIPVLFLHGGPGGGFDDNDKRFFDPNVWNVLLFDQRGSGRSKPYASLKGNTTQKLIEDINLLLKVNNFDKIMLFGGSWGATLALLYAITNKDKVSGMLLRGIYLGNSADIKHLLNGAIKDYFPEYFERFISLVPKNKRKDILNHYFISMTNGKNKNKFAYEWSFFESAVLKMKMKEKDIINDLKDGSYKALSPIEAWYMIKRNFVPDNYILKNAPRLSDLPVSIVHGRYDFVTPPINAWNLHKNIKNSKLYFVFAGHSSSELETEKKLKSELKKFAKLLK